MPRASLRERWTTPLPAAAAADDHHDDDDEDDDDDDDDSDDDDDAQVAHHTRRPLRWTVAAPPVPLSYSERAERAAELR